MLARIVETPRASSVTDASAATSSGRTQGGAIGIAIAIGAGIVAALMHREAPVLAPPDSGHGLIDLLAIGMSRASRNAPLGEHLLWLEIIATGLTVAAFALLGRRIAGPWIAAAAAVALGLTRPFALTLAPPAVLLVALAALTFLALLAEAWTALLVIAVVAMLCAPALGVMYLALAAVLWRRVPRRLAGGLAIAALAAPALSWFIPALPSAVDAVPRFAWSAHALLHMPSQFWSFVVSPAGPYAIGLAALGLWGVSDIVPRGSRASAAGVALLPLLVLGGVVSAPPLHAFAFAFVFFWMLVTRGLAIVVQECRPNLGGRVASILLIALLPLLQAAQPAETPLPARVPHGHAALSPAAYGRLVAALPDSAVLVREDALTDVLLRSQDGTWQRTGKSLRTIDRESSALGALAQSPSTHIFALPSAQASLQSRGFRLSDAPPPQMRGVAQVAWGGSCAPLTQTWSDVSAVASAETIAVVAEDDASRGTVELRVGGDRPFEPQQIQWTAYAAPGFAKESYDAGREDDRTRLDEDLADASVPRGTGLEAAAHGLALTIWRRPGAPPTLMVGLGAAPSLALARYAPGDEQHLSLCPAFPREISDLEAR
jgi:hypothetical protein